jgi:hypothetical protein
VIARVTDRAQSSVNGQIVSTINGANLYLINPSGVVFGPNAKVNVLGSFHASTADYIKMSDGTKFQATNADDSTAPRNTINVAAPVAFGFMTMSPAAIAVNGSTLSPVRGGTLGLVAGPISITSAPDMGPGANLFAPTGRIHVTSAAGKGEVPVDPSNTSTSALTVTSFGPVTISGGSTLNVSDRANLGSGGSVFIRSGALTVEASNINADNYGSGPGGQRVLRGEEQVRLSSSTVVQSIARSSGTGAGVMISTAPTGVISASGNSLVVLDSRAAGDAGALDVSAGKLTLSDGWRLLSRALGSGRGGPIAISADSVLLDGGASSNPSTGIVSVTAIGAGSGGSIAIVAGELILHNSANVAAQSFGVGAGGGVSVSVGGALTIDSGASIGTTATAVGAAGNVSVTVTGPITIDMSVGAVSSVLNGIGSLTVGNGNAGDVSVTAGALDITRNGLISSFTTGAGNIGNSGNVSATYLGCCRSVVSAQRQGLRRVL